MIFRRPSLLALQVLLAAVPLSAVTAGPATADSLVSLPEPDYAAPARNVQLAPLLDGVTAIVYPTRGCTALVAPGDELAPVVLLADGGATADFRARVELSRHPARAPVVRLTRDLSRTGLAYDAATGTYRLRFAVPPDVPEDAYDLVVESAALPNGGDRQTNAVRVRRARADFEFSLIADTQIRDPTTTFPQKFEQVLNELRLRDVAFTFLSGDLNFGSDYPQEYAENRAIVDRAGLPLHVAAGNHDGYAWLDPKTAAVEYDGLHHYKRTFGPLLYSFRVGTYRFVVTNSFDGPPERRNAFSFLTVNSGGQYDPAQLAWIDAEARAATAAGEEVLVVSHHDPHGNVTANVVAYPWSLSNVGASGGPWNDAASKTAFRRIVEETRVRYVLYGHQNHDRRDDVTVGAGTALGPHPLTWLMSRSPCNSPEAECGYRVFDVRGGAIASFEFDAAAGVGSVPFPLGGNLALALGTPNDGSRARVAARVDSRLARPVDVTLPLVATADPRGVRATAGTIREVALTDLGAYLVYVRVTVPAQGGVEVVVEPDPSGAGALPGFVAGGSAPGGGSPSPAPAGPTTTAGAPPNGGGGGGGGCAVGASAPQAAMMWLLGFGALAAIRVTARRRRT